METPAWPANCESSVPNRVIPSARTFTSVVQHLRDYGTFKPQTHDRNHDRTEKILQAEEQILECVGEERDISSQFAAEVEIAQLSASYISALQEQTLHPHHIQEVQALEPADFSRHVIYCQSLLQQCCEHLNFLNFILFTDEAGFNRNVCARIVNNRLVGPYVIPNKLNRHNTSSF